MINLANVSFLIRKAQLWNCGTHNLLCRFCLQPDQSVASSKLKKGNIYAGIGANRDEVANIGLKKKTVPTIKWIKGRD